MWPGAKRGGNQFHGARRGAYGTVKINGQNLYIHRLMYEVIYGPLGAEVAHHECRTPLCGNPWHLKMMTDEENKHLQAHHA